jgi:mannosyltransferase OCH1-like enzyme
MIAPSAPSDSGGALVHFKGAILNTCTQCGFTAKCGCVFERVDGKIVCKKCLAKAKGEELAADLKVEMESQMKELYNAKPIEFEVLQRIPRMLHFVWVGTNRMNSDNRKWIRTWLNLNPEYRAILWASHPSIHQGILDGLEIRDLPPMINQWAFDNISKWVKGRATIASQSDIVRMEVIAQYGGIYIDTDVEAIQPLGNILRGVNLFYADEFGPAHGNYLFGAVPNHPATWTAVRELVPWLLNHTKSENGKRLAMPFGALEATGPSYLAPKLRNHADCVIYPSILFNPLWARGDSSNAPQWPTISIANHHYQGTWYEQTKQIVSESRSNGFYLEVE